MEKQAQYIVGSLELHLFFARIMKEHSLFLMAGFTPANAAFTREAEQYKRDFEALLMQAVHLSDGVVSKTVLCSGEVYTDFTAGAERQTQRFTGIHIDGRITALEECLSCGEAVCPRPELVRRVRQLNQRALRLLDGLIRLKERVLEGVLSCRMFTMNYPLLIEHIIREAKLYRTFLRAFENGEDLDCRNMRQTEQFWNQIMMEHALFIRGLLDPTENELAETSHAFAKDYAKLLKQSREQNDKTMCDESLEETMKFRDFKAAGTMGIQSCKIRSIILPLLADHVLREANHYIRLLNESGRSPSDEKIL